MGKEYKFSEESIDDISLLEPEATYSYADYLRWTFEERVELIKGKIFPMSPAPKRVHQKLDVRILNSIYNFLENRKCEVYTAPFDVRLPKNLSDPDEQTFTIVQPDICVICDLSKLDDARCKGAPDLIVEILSPSSAERDLRHKYHIYEEHGVKEYWIVYPEEEIIEIFILNNDSYQTAGKLFRSDVIQSTVLKGFSLNLNDLFVNL